MRIDRTELLAQLRLAWTRLRALPRGLWAVLPAAAIVYVLMHVPFTPSVADVRKAKTEPGSVMLAADGTVLAEFKRARREWRGLDRISPYVVQALIATEDHRFLEHHGVDLRRTASAAWSTLRGDRQGGSTITQQLARNLYPDEIGHDVSLSRKVKEALTALKIEANYTKPEILETYLNTVPFLYNATGIEMAARTYFGKPASRLDVLESATLVGMLKGTSQYNPVQNPQRSRERRNLVLEQMAKYGFLPQERLRALQAQPLRLDFTPQRDDPGPAPHLAQQVKAWLAQWAERHHRDPADGLVVRTTIDARLQAAANEAVAQQIARLEPLARQRSREQPLQAGFVAIDPRSGEVRAWVGSADFAQDQFDHVQQAKRQPGSTFKPFVYGAAFAHGMQPTDVFIDRAVTLGRGKNQWSPRDATPPTNQPMTLADGLAYSRNSITAQVMDKVKPQRVARLARAMGVRESTLDAVPSLALGTSPVTLKEMVASYATIANGGRYLAPVIVTAVEDRGGRVLESFHAPRPEQALGEAESLMLVDALRGVVDRGTGRAIRSQFGITADVAGKTGTTQDNTDGWFILMHPQLVAGAWVGFNDSRATMGDSWGPGATSALPIVGTVFREALDAGWIDPRAHFGPAPAREEEASAGPWWTRTLGAPARYRARNEAEEKQAPVESAPAPQARAPEPAPAPVAPSVPLAPVPAAPAEPPTVIVIPAPIVPPPDPPRVAERRERHHGKHHHRKRDKWEKWQERQAKAWEKEWKRYERQRERDED